MKEYCVVVRSGLELWVTREQAEKITKALTQGIKFIGIGDNLVNQADIVGIYNEDAMYEKAQKRRGLWQASNGAWYSKSDTSENWREPLVGGANTDKAMPLSEAFSALALSMGSKRALENKQQPKTSDTEYEDAIIRDAIKGST